MNIQIRWGSLIKGINQNNKYQTIIHFILYIRKICFTFIIVNLYKYTKIQLIIVMILSLIISLIIFKTKPYEGKALNLINSITELLFIAILVILYFVILT